MSLTLVNSTVKNIVGHGALIYHFSAGGLDVHDKSGTRLAYATLAVVVGGAVNDNGVYLATSDGGVHKLSHTSVTTGGDRTADLVQAYHTGSTPALQSNTCAGIAGKGTALLVTHAAGADFFPDEATAYQYTDAGGCGACAIGSGQIAYALTSGCHVKTTPAADWSTATHLDTTAETGVVFDGVNDHIVVPTVNINGWTGFALEVWATPDDITTKQHVELSRQATGSGPDWLLAFQDYGTHLSFGLRTSAGYKEFDVTITSGDYTNGPHHIAAVFNGSTMEIFVDGSSIGSTSHSGTCVYAAAAGGHAIGCFWNGSVATEFFDGALRDVRLWNTARSAAEINADKSTVLVGDESGLVGLWRLDDGSGTTAVDATVNGRDGTLTGGPIWLDSSVVILSDTVQALAYGDALFIGTAAGISVYDGGTVSDLTTPLGPVLDVKSVAVTPAATANSGLLAYATSDGANGGRSGIIDLAEV